jgi:hypothetical protein
MIELKAINIKEEKMFDDVVFPLTLAPPDNDKVKTIEDTLDFLNRNKQAILNELLDHGAILFRSFPVETAEEFNRFVLTFGWNDMPYVGGIAFRSNVVGVVHTA